MPSPGGSPAGPASDLRASGAGPQVTGPCLGGAYVRGENQAKRRFLDELPIGLSARKQVGDDGQCLGSLAPSPEDLAAKSKETEAIAGRFESCLEGFEIGGRRDKFTSEITKKETGLGLRRIRRLADRRCRAAGLRATEVHHRTGRDD